MITAMSHRFPDMPMDERMRHIGMWMSTNPARQFGLVRKGEIVAGNDADIVLVHPSARWIVRKADLFTKCGWSAAEGEQLLGRPTHTLVHGTLVYEHGHVSNPTGGRHIP
jgi:dihydroorotase-like cyclic amidohydrolase